MIYVNLIIVLVSFHHVNCLFSSSIPNGLKSLSNKVNNAGYRNVSTYGPLVMNWIEQPVDHFNDSDNRVFKIKYLEKLHRWAHGGPVYLFIEHYGNEYQLLDAGLVYELASETNGAMFAAEHRYYGAKQPFDITKPEQLKFLSSRQALADLAKLIKKIKSSPEFKSSPVIVIGGFYGGNLAVWMRELYPDLVDAAIASSAPVLAKADFFEYLETLGDIYEKYGTPGCFDEITQVFKRYKRMLRNKETREVLKREENICEDTNMDNSYNQQWFMQNNALKFASNVVSEYSDIQKSCKNPSEFVKTCNNWNEEKQCCDYRISNYIKQIKEDNFQLLWFYQRCTEFGFIQTSKKNRPFTASIFKGLDYKICKKLFGKDFDGARLKDGVQTTNNMYGGLQPNVTKVVFVNGGLDPWQKLSVAEDLSTDVPSIFLPSLNSWISIFLEMHYPSNEMVEAINDIKKIVKQWIGA